jgi:hypothetical protein
VNVHAGMLADNLCKHGSLHGSEGSPLNETLAQSLEREWLSHGEMHRTRSDAEWLCGIVSVDQQRMQHACSTAEGRITYSPGVWKHAIRRVVHRVHQSFLPAPAEVGIPLVVLLDGEQSCVGGIDRTNSDGPRLQSLKTSGAYPAPSIDSADLGSGSHCTLATPSTHSIPRFRPPRFLLECGDTANEKTSVAPQRLDDQVSDCVGKA